MVSEIESLSAVERRDAGKVLIVDDDHAICEVLREMMLVWGVQASSALDAEALFAACEEGDYGVILLDVYLDDVSGLDLIPTLKEQFPTIKVIIMTGYADKETAVTALRLGAFDFLEKPIDMDFLSHVVQRALDLHRAEEKELELLQDLKESQEELLDHKNRLEHLNLRLLETNKALTVFAQNIDREREELQKRILFKLKSVVSPAIQKLQTNKNLLDRGSELEFLITQMIEELTSDLTMDGKLSSVLSPTEFRIATLIKNGLTTEDIATQLSVSPSTVRTHRKNIRRKLKINSTQYNLKNYLLSG
ncbi:response regulator [Desulfoferrobacter suflitae]|uniref:response regulator n=1 Tax=Desulfoferrobacter suflitae TaxID=2865782 RepID=UPI0021645410|nr:response regulator [Desulfoferrobacter suflitae]MCK8603896.1 response regulator [Desulfoferrobacter suflitae]